MAAETLKTLGERTQPARKLIFPLGSRTGGPKRRRVWSKSSSEYVESVSAKPRVNIHYISV